MLLALLPACPGPVPPGPNLHPLCGQSPKPLRGVWQHLASVPESKQATFRPVLCSSSTNSHLVYPDGGDGNWSLL